MEAATAQLDVRPIESPRLPILAMTDTKALVLSAKIASLLLRLLALASGLAAAVGALVLIGDEVMLRPLQHIAAWEQRIIVLAGLAFLVWWGHAFVRARTVDVAAVEGLSTGWAVGSWFVPILGLYFPYRVATAMWWAISSQKEPRPKAPVHLSVWWGCYLGYLLTSIAASRTESLEVWTLAAIFGAITAIRSLRVVSTLSGSVQLAASDLSSSQADGVL